MERHMMKKHARLRIRIPATMLALLIAAPSIAAAQSSKRPANYLAYAVAFADALLAHGTDKVGTRHLPMWAGLIDTRDYSIPEGTAAEAERTKSGDRYFDAWDRRSVGGANIAQDLETLQLFDVLSALTRNPKYAKAGDDYVAAFLRHTQNEHTGLLGWGEHLYYDFYRDTVMVGGNTAESDWTHELLPKKPIWDRLWRADSARTRRAIQALRFHFNSPYTHTYLFNRHASWQKVTRLAPVELRGTGIEQYQEHRAAFVGHAGQFAYAFMFLYNKTNDPEWLRWSRGVGRLHWTYRDSATGLIPWNVDARTPVGPKFVGTTGFALRLYQTFESNRTQTEMRDHALALFDAVERHAWRADGAFYMDDLNMDASPVRADDPRFDRGRAAGDPVTALQVRPRFFGGNPGRAAAYLYAREQDPRHLAAARRMLAIMERDTLPARFYAGAVAGRIHLLMDVYDLTHEPELLREAARYADRGVAGLWRGGLFARRVDDPFYESNDGVGGFVGGLLRIHLARNPGAARGTAIDWSY
jgi:hypothetical protein